MLRTVLAILWPSFLVAIVAEGIFFSAFHPEHLLAAHPEWELPALGVYTLGFFFFWVIAAASGWLSCYLRGDANS